jgi:aminopeptidase YwaD
MDERHLRALIGERHPVTAPDALRRAEAYLIEQFTFLGLDVSTHPFRALGGTYRNVIATISPSAAVPSSPPPLIVAAHYDTVEASPGADDNASALAVLLEVARSLGGVPLARGVRFIAFCLEEENLLGSLAYAASLQAANEEICGAIVLECVGYARSEEGSQQKPSDIPVTLPTVGDFLGMVGNAASAHLVKAVEAAANDAVPDLKTISLVVPGNGELLPDTRRSDHAAFWHYGYPAVMLTDTANFRNPHYHQPTDTFETLNLDFLEQVARAVTAAAIALCTATQSTAQRRRDASIWKEAALTVPHLATLAANLMADGRVPAQAKATLAGVTAYLAMPFDLIPDFIPVLGYLDDLVLVILVFDGVVNQIDEAIVADYWKGDPATLQRLKAVSRRAARFIPGWIKRRMFGRSL